MKIYTHSYDYYILAFSGGKDSIACLLHLLDIGIPIHKIELWHHRIDGYEGSTLMDWPVTDDYCRKFAEAFRIPIFYSWKVGGFEQEMLRENRKTNSTKFEYLKDNIIECGLTGGVRGKDSTRLKFPQVTANLSQRWCSAYLKVDVCTAAINNQERFIGKRTLVITGERAEESSARAKYKEFEPDRTDNRDSKSRPRHVDHWRPVHQWSEHRVWSIIERYKVTPHPAYILGWGRLSCMFCIFGSSNQWKSASLVDPLRTQRIVAYEKQFETSIHRTKYLPVRIAAGIEYENVHDPRLVALAMNTVYTGEIISTGCWELPAGAFGESVGPT